MVSPGQVVGIAVSAPASTTPSQVLLAGERPLSLLETLPSLPAQASVLIPTTSPLRTLALTAFGVGPDGALVRSTPVLLVVERPDAPVEIGTESASMIFEAPGGELPILVWATFADGSTLDATESTRVSYSSSSPNVATVSNTGVVSALTAGAAEIAIEYRLDSVIRRSLVTVTVPAALVEIVPPILSFPQQNVGVPERRSVTITNRSLGPVTVLGVEGEGDYTAESNCPTLSPLEPDRSCTIEVTFMPSEVGERSGFLEVATSFYSSPIGVPLRGTGSGRQASLLALASSSSPSVFGEPVLLTASVGHPGGATATGTVRFTSGTRELASAPVSDGVARVSDVSWAVGTYGVLAEYSGDGAFAPSAATFSQEVRRAETAMTLESSASPVILGESITLTARVAVLPLGAGDVTGTIGMLANGVTVATAALTGNQPVSLPLNLGVGVHALHATYSGNENFNGSGSQPLTQRVEYQPAGGGPCRGEAGHTILQPIRADGTSVFNQGRTVPAKFRVCDAAGRSIGTPGVVSDFRLTQIIAGTASNVNETVPSTTPDTAFRWDSGAEQWIFNISTASQAANKTYVYTVTLNDGTTLSFRYGLR